MKFRLSCVSPADIYTQNGQQTGGRRTDSNRMIDAADGKESLLTRFRAFVSEDEKSASCVFGMPLGGERKMLYQNWIGMSPISRLQQWHAAVAHNRVAQNPGWARCDGILVVCAYAEAQGGTRRGSVRTINLRQMSLGLMYVVRVETTYM